MIRRALLLVIPFLVLNLAACDDEDTCNCLLRGDPTPRLDNVWPREDGRQWTYDFTATSWIDETTAPMDSFTIDDVDSLLMIAPGAPAGLQDEAGLWRLQFTGTGTTDSGVEGQLLAGTYFVDDRPVRRIAPGEPLDFVRRLVPPQRATASELLARRVYGPGGLLMAGDAIFEFDDEFIGTYSDVDQSIGWKYLEANLEVGHTFTMQLVPDLAEDVFLHVRVRAVRDLVTSYGIFPNTVSVDYLIDQGMQTITNEIGQAIGQSRAYTLGRIEYAPEVGPVYCIERAILPKVDGVSESGYGFDYEHVLIGAGLLEL